MLKDFHLSSCLLTEEIRQFQSISEQENNCEEGINLTPQDRIGTMDCCKCGCECKLMATFAGSSCLLLRLKFQSARGTFRHSALMGNCPTITRVINLIYLVNEFFFLFLVQLNNMRTLGESKVLSFSFFVITQWFDSFPTVFLQARWRNLVHLECLQMIKPMVIGFCSIGG